MLLVPNTLPDLSRRQVLAGGVALALIGVTASACSSEPAAPAVDPLESQLALAQRDSELATAAAAAAAPPIARALTEVASERSQHAQALANEIARVAGTPTPTSTQPTTGAARPSRPPSTSSQVIPPPSVADVVNSLRGSADGAAQLADRSSGYRAGLLGSIAAACTAGYSVALVFGGPKP